MTTRRAIEHNAGRRRAVDRQRPRKGKRAQAVHADKYAGRREEPAADELSEKLAELADHFNERRLDRA